MASHATSLPPDGEPRATGCLFTVRLWKEELGGRSEYRGTIRDVRTDAFTGFREWADLVAFMVSRIERHPSEGGRT